MARALDSDGFLDLAAAKANGAEAVGLYLGGNLTEAVAQEAADLDMGVWSFAENAASDPNGGATQGVADGNQWADAADAIHQPLSAPIFVPNDQEVTDEQATLDYFQAAAQTIRRRSRTPGFYGQTSVWDQVKGFGYKYFVKANDGTEENAEANIVQAWQNGKPAPQIVIDGVNCDVDDIQTPKDFGGWNAKGLFPQSAVQPPPQAKEDSMYLIHVSDPENAPAGYSQTQEWYLLCGGKLSQVATSDIGHLNADASLLRMNGAVVWATVKGFAV